MKLSTRRLAVLACVVTLVGPPGLGGVACTRPSSPAPSEAATTGTISFAIQGGAADTTSSFAVAVLDAGNQTCSGTLIAPNLVLTARHCIADDSGGSFVDCTTDDFSAPKTAKSFHVSTAPAATFNDSPYVGSKILVPSETKFCGNDIALLILDAKIPSSEAKPAAPGIDTNATSTYGAKITTIGYGTTAPGAADDGKRRRRDAVPLQCIPGDKVLDCDPSDYAMTTKELATGDGLCEGDSGSGAYVTSSITSASAPLVVGVLSRASDTGAQCTDAVFTRTDMFRAFLIAGAKEAATAGGYPLPTWAGGDAGAEVEEPTADAASTTPPGDEGNPADAGTSAPGATASGNDKGCQLSPGIDTTSSFSIATGLAILMVLSNRRRRRL